MDIETKRLLLRPLHNDDAPVMARRLNNYEVSKNLARVPFPYTLEVAHFFINLQRQFDELSKVCAIAFKCAPDELLGVVAYEFSAEKDEVEFGYWLSECCWGQRIMSEAAAELVRYTFTQTQILGLGSGYHTDNPNSGRILRKLGFEETHQEMNHSLAQGKDVPVTKLRLTRERWEAGLAFPAHFPI
jgi:RimJ/RimL family protein N-acetyltransferase